MDRLPRPFVACGLGLLLATAGCRSTRTEVPPGRPYAKDGQQRKAIEFSSDGHPISAAASTNFMPNGLGGSNLASGIGSSSVRPDGAAFGAPPGAMVRRGPPACPSQARTTRRPPELRADRSGHAPPGGAPAGVASVPVDACPAPDLGRHRRPGSPSRCRARPSFRRSTARERWAAPTRRPARCDPGRPRMSDPLAVLWEDPHGLAVAKPAGLLTQGPVGGEETLEDLVRHHLRPDDPASVYLGTVHRLDRPVSGVVLWAKTPKAARRWAEQFARRAARKEYWAIVEVKGDLERFATLGTWDDRLSPPDETGRARIEGSGAVEGVDAVRDRRGEGRPRGPGLAQALARDGSDPPASSPSGRAWVSDRRRRHLRGDPGIPRRDRTARAVADGRAPGRPAPDHLRSPAAGVLGRLAGLMSD